MHTLPATEVDFGRRQEDPAAEDWWGTETTAKAQGERQSQSQGSGREMIGIPPVKSLTMLGCWVKFWNAFFPLEISWKAGEVPDSWMRRKLPVFVKMVHSVLGCKSIKSTTSTVRKTLKAHNTFIIIIKTSYAVWLFRCCTSCGLAKICRGLEPYSVRSYMASTWVGPTCGFSDAFGGAVMGTNLLPLGCVDSTAWRKIQKNVSKVIAIVYSMTYVILLMPHWFHVARSLQCCHGSGLELFTRSSLAIAGRHSQMMCRVGSPFFTLDLSLDGSLKWHHLSKSQHCAHASVTA